MTAPLSPRLESTDFYQRLGIRRDASQQDIKSAYLSLVRRYTPERAPDRFKRIREAYETLSNPTARAQYDDRPLPHIATLLDGASAAMKEGHYSTAEHAYKQVLLEVPSLRWVRNLLGLCFLYQDRAQEALVQYQRLVRESGADAAVHGNTAHAYRMLKRFEEAEREFRAAMHLAGDQNLEYSVALIDMWLEAGAPDRAEAIARAEAEASPAASVTYFELSAKRIEIALVKGKEDDLTSLTQLVVRQATTAGQKSYAAFALGKLATRFIAGQAFGPAARIAHTAVVLDPQDTDYDGQLQVSRFLLANDFDSVERVLNTHVSFATGGWLNPLKTVVRDYCREHAVFKGMLPVSSPPTMARVNGVGTALYGRREIDERTRTFVATLYFVVFLIPIIPLACYRVRTAPGGGWYFLGKVPYGPVQKVHWVAFVSLVIGWLILQSAQTPLRPASVSPIPMASSCGVEPDPQSEQLAVYMGEAVNLAIQGTATRSDLTVSFCDWDRAPNGYMKVHPPLGGSGPLTLLARADTVAMISISSVGDTIVWYGARSGLSVSGNYRIVGGPFVNQYGTWRMTRILGDTIPTWVELRRFDR